MAEVSLKSETGTMKGVEAAKCFVRERAQNSEG